MVDRFEFIDDEGDEIALDSNDLAQRLEEIYETKVKLTKKPAKIPAFYKWSTAAFFVCMGLLVFTGWDYETRRNHIEDRVEYEYYVRFLAFNFPPYKKETLSRLEHTRLRMADAGLEYRPETDSIYSVKNGKIILETGPINHIRSPR